MIELQQYCLMESSVTKWEWDVFGNTCIIIKLNKEVSCLARFTCKYFLGSKWKRVRDEK